MGRVSNHLAGLHKRLAAKDRGDEKDFDTLEKCFGTIADVMKASKADLKDSDGTLSESLSKGMEACANLRKRRGESANSHEEEMAECEKAVAASDLEKSPMEPLPAGLSRVAPERTPTIRPVPRTGAPQMPMDKANAGHIGAIDFLGLKDLDEL
jgi:hypothetical protein